MKRRLPSRVLAGAAAIALVLVPQVSQADGLDAMSAVERDQAMNFAYCVVAVHSGDLRWFAFLMKNQNSKPVTYQRGAMQNALNSIKQNCPPIGAGQLAPAMGYANFISRVHANSENVQTAEDPVGSCLVQKMPIQSKLFLEDNDRLIEEAADANDKGEKVSFDQNSFMQAFGGKMLKECLDLMPADLRLNRLYSRINWLLRAEPALATARVGATQNGATH